MRIGIGLDLFEEGYKVNIFGLRIPIPFEVRDPRDIMETWGISYSEKAIFLRWGTKCKILWMPWDWGSCVRSEVLNSKHELEKQGGYIYQLGQPRLNEDDRKEYTDTYTYVLKSGEVQNRVATYYVGEMEWRWRIFHRLYKYGIKIGPKIISRTINVTFDNEVGEKSGSWKGGCTGCGYKIRKNESPYECLRRMERERKF